ncbi:hypothetical protein [Shimazuella kribbensis]|uniref:hypothetical protein n=1 Tax=Shimazuella kribbensis TaxID=139808 RepID=UPI0003FC3559|nr:hypothetical protein [Shimazuella kribbensis]
MFNEIEKFINYFIDGSGNRLLLEDLFKYGENKIEFIISSNNFTTSISVLSDLTYDFLTIDMETEDFILNKTKYPKTLDELFVQINMDLKEFMSL